MQTENNLVLTGTYTTTQITATFEKQALVFASKDRDGQWVDGDIELYIKPELQTQHGIQSGDKIKIGGFLVFNFFVKADGTRMCFPKVIATEIKEIEKATGGQPAAIQPTQPQAMAPMQPPMPGGAPIAPVYAQQPGYGMPPPPTPPMPGAAQYAAR